MAYRMGKPRTFKPGENKRNDRDEKGPKLGYLSEEMMAYYRQVSATLEAGFDEDDPSSKRDFLNNVFKALTDEGIKASQNQTVSRILEFLLSHSEAMHIRILFCVFCKDLSTVSFDRFASHVLQTLVKYLPTMYDDADADETERASLKSAVEQLCQFSLSQIRQFLTDTYGSHVLRSLLEVLGGVHVKEEVVRSHISRNQRKDTDGTSNLPVSEQLSSDFKAHFDSIRNKVFSLCNYADHLTDPNYCPVLQTVLLILHKSDTEEYSRLAKTIMEKACPPTENADKDDVAKNLPTVVQDSVGSYLIELLVSLTSETEIEKLYEQLFKGKLIYFAVHPVANYVLQKLFSCITSKAMLKEVVLEASQFMEDILAVNHVGVITKLAEACRKNQAQQEQFTQAVMKAFHCDDPKERQIKIAPLISSMQTYDVFFPPPKAKEDTEEESSDKPPPALLKSVNIHGSLLLQQMLQFDRPKLIVTSLLALSPAELSNMASDQCGSHMVEAFFTSSTVWERNKDEFLKKIKGLYVSIACSKNGSRCLEGIWKECTLKMKIIIAEDLITSRERIESDRFGHFLHHNFVLLKFATRKKEWIDLQSGVKKKQQMLQAILEGNTGKKKKNRKRKALDANSKENEEQPEEKIESVVRQDDEGDRDNSDVPDASQTVGKKRKKSEGETPSKKEKKKEKSSNDGETNSNGLDDSLQKKSKKKKNKKKKLKVKE